MRSLLGISLFSFTTAHAVIAPPHDPQHSKPSETQEAARLEARARAVDLTQLMDESTPAELAAEFGFDGDSAKLDDAAFQSPLVTIDVNITTQTIVAQTPQGTLGPWPVSTAAPGYENAVGTFAIDPNRVYDMWYSIKYNRSPMPNAMFFTGGFAIHGTDHWEHLGTPASHGCVRMGKAYVKMLFDVVQPIVKAHGVGSATVNVHY